MTQTPQFRSRALAVREEARQRLLQVRQSRLAQKQSLLANIAEPESDPGEPPETVMEAEIADAPDHADAPDGDFGDLVPPEVRDRDLAAPAIIVTEDAIIEPAASLENASPPAFLDEPRRQARETPRKAPRAAAASTKVKPARSKPAAPPPSARGPAPRLETAEDLSARRAALAEMETIAPLVAGPPEQPDPEPETDMDADLPSPEFEAMTEVEAAPEPVESAPEEVESPAEPLLSSVPGPSPQAEDCAESVVEAAEEPVETFAEGAPASAETRMSEAEAAPSAESAAASDLLLLPGAAPGLVWLLQEIGVRNLSDLAKMEPETLAAGLGIVGRILDVSIWTRFARNHVTPEAVAPV